MNNRKSRFIITILKPHFLLFLSGFLTAGIKIFLTLSAPCFISQIIDKAIAGGSEKLLINFLLLSIPVFILYGITAFINSICCSCIFHKIDHDLKIKFHERIICKPVPFFKQYDAAKLAGEISDRIPCAASVLSCVPAGLFIRILTLIIILIIMVNIDPLTAIVVFIVLLVLIPVKLLPAGKIRTCEDSIIEISARANDLIKTYLTGFKIIKYLRSYDYSLGKLKPMIKYYADKSIHKAGLESFSSIIIKGVYFILFAAVLFLGGSLIISNRLTPGTLAAMIIYAGIAGVQMMEIPGTRLKVLKAKEAFDYYLDIVCPRAKDTFKVTLDKLDYGIKIDDICYSCNGREIVLNQLSLELSKGKCYRITGGNAPGKSALIDLITGIDSPWSGTVRLDDSLLDTLTDRSLGNLMGIIPDDLFLLNGTVRENIKAGRHFDDFDIIELAVKLGIPDVVMGEHLNLNTVLLHNGSNQTIEQCWKIALMRALISKPVIIILDHAVPFLEKNTKKAIESYLVSIKNSCIIIFTEQPGELLIEPDDVIRLDNNQTGSQHCFAGHPAAVCKFRGNTDFSGRKSL